ncbi:hypothetical protein [Halobacillus dabanensis]|uniref:hypothetical protein n=1 Tax=Halobacillus dabanensis TaxID=240302 RepID=UPI000944E371|nr:hypothetical protein [Halobacillus dabanensis]
MKKYFPFLMLLFIFLFAGYLDSHDSTSLEPSNLPGSVDTDDTETSSSEGNSPSTTWELGMILEGTKIVDGTKVETYREYEVYKDENGNIVKRVPTSNYNYLRYE